MAASLSIGEFSRLTHLSVKTLRYYHDIGLMLPASVDPATGYRRYTTGQIDTALLIRRLRDIDMPLAELRSVLDTADDNTRAAAIVGYLDRMERRLVDAQHAVRSLRDLVLDGTRAITIEYRTTIATPSIARIAVVQRDDITPWCAETYPLLYGALGLAQAAPIGPGGALYDADFFEAGEGQVVAFVPLSAEAQAVPAGLDRFEVPAATLAVATHVGPFEELDRTYGLLGRSVIDRSLATTGSIREYYLMSPGDTDDPAQFRTEVCWPIHHQPGEEP
jgi:DNA-binding transcriptional MerR regulator